MGQSQIPYVENVEVFEANLLYIAAFAIYVSKIMIIIVYGPESASEKEITFALIYLYFVQV